MQLFVCDFQLKKNKIIIEDKNILYQLRKVLRSKIWDYFFVQKNWITDYRYKIKIEDRDDKKLIWDIIDSLNNNKSKNFSGMIICMPNKWDKAEMIVQKLTEIWIDHIVFWPSERSVIKQINNLKIQRLEKISKEAMEQSWWWNLAKIEFVYDLKSLLTDSKLIVFDSVYKYWSTFIKLDQKRLKVYWLVWPEGGLTEKDYKNFWSDFDVISLWENVLRTETAAIIGCWEIIKAKSWKLKVES